MRPGGSTQYRPGVADRRRPPSISRSVVTSDLQFPYNLPKPDQTVQIRLTLYYSFVYNGIEVIPCISPITETPL